ncbi:hypothetical protein AB0A63_12050 [Lentzea sp. NPDC042327]|uniref:hypothetical protein n=1 Tax=Lentzea sp. NPDC042327 TaxID=3154801 RepID=UPI0033CB009A
MSSSVGYYLSPADLEAQRRRQLRADIAGTLARLAEMRAHARAVGVKVPAVAGEHRADGVTDLTELEELRARASAAVADATEAVDAGWSQRWRATIGKATGGTAATTASAAQELAARRVPAQHTPARREGDAVAAALADAETLLAGNGHRCDADGLAAAQAVYEEMKAVTSLQRARTYSLEVAVLVRESIERRKRLVAQEEQRARLRQLLADVLEEEQPALLALVAGAADPDEAEDAVHRAVERADLARHRRRVAAAAAEALSELDCVVGEEFESLLVEETQAVVAFDGAQRGYGLLVRLPGDGTALLTAVVRAADQDAEGEHAKAVQSHYCDETLPQLDSALRERGVELDPAPFLRLEPGRPVPAAPAPLPPSRRKTRPAVRRRATEVPGVRQRER